MSNWRGKSLWSVSSRFVNAGFAFLLNVILARLLSQDDLGSFFLSLSVAWGGALVCQFGGSILAVKWIATARARGDHEAVRTSAWSLLLFTMVQGAMVGSTVFLLDRPLVLVAVWAAWMFSVGLQSLVPELLRGFDDLKWASLLSGPISQGLSVCFLGSLWLFQVKISFVEAAMLVIAANLICSAIGIFLIARRAAPTFRLANYQEFLKETTPIALSLGATYLLTQADLWICGYLLPKNEVAVYGIAQRFVAFVSMPMMIFGSVVTPKLAELLQAKRVSDPAGAADLSRVVVRGTFITSLFSLAVYLGGALLGFPVMTFLFGNNYGAAYPLFLILGLGQFLHTIAGPVGYILLLSGEQSAAMRATFGATVVLGVCSYLGGIFAGAKGIAFGSCAALTFQTVWMWWEVRKRLKLDAKFKWETNWKEAA